MERLARTLLTSWSWRLEVIIPLLILGLLFTQGWRRLRRQSRPADRPPARGLVVGWRLAAYWAGLLAVGLALLSPLDALSGWLFSAHMIQHLLLMMLAPPLLMLANPLPFVLWGLPRRWRLGLGRLLARGLHREAASRRWLRRLTSPGVLWLAMAATLLGWHDPAAYDLALRQAWAHRLEHVSFFLPALLYWWLVTGAGPRIHRQLPPLARIAFVVAAIPVNMFLGVSIAFAEEPLYAHYAALPRLWGIPVLRDQAAAGMIMWVPGSMMYLLAGLLLLGVWLGRDGGRTRPVTAWDGETMEAHGWRQGTAG